MRLTRRESLKGLLAAAGAGVLPFGLNLHAHEHGNAPHKLCVFVQANGGWDPTSFCDPKANTPGERVINNWAKTNEVQQVGNIQYAPFVQNQSFFEKYYERMLVINGVDAQTNSHTVGVVHNWSGMSSEGYPTATAMYASNQGADLTMPYLNYGGYSVTGGLTRFTRLHDPNGLRNIAVPSKTPDGSRSYLTDEDWVAIDEFAQTKSRRKAEAERLLPNQYRQLSHYQSAYEADGLSRFADAISQEPTLEQTERNGGYRSNLRKQAQITVLAFKTGVALSADMFLGGFDTHENHDVRQGYLIDFLTSGVDYLWDYAEQHGVADRLFVVIGSDFGRTNFYNADNGKDHWPIGSYVIMEKGQDWTNRMVGYTDELHFAKKVNPTTLQRDDFNGTIIYPKHVHRAIRSYLGMDSSMGAQKYPLNNTEDFTFFGI